MRVYETTFVINPQTDDTAIDSQVKAVVDTITSSGGKPTYENRMGTRRLAYDIKGLSQGYYTSIIFEAPVEAMAALDRLYQLEEEYIRYLTVLYDGPDPETLEKQRAQGEFPFQRNDRSRGGGGRPDRDSGSRPEPGQGRRPGPGGPRPDAPANSPVKPEASSETPPVDAGANKAEEVKPAEVSAAPASEEAPKPPSTETAVGPADGATDAAIGTPKEDEEL